ncbi:AAA family ATPase [Candidatus Woesearchaeota archaeon]|nr:AAA family ATPase [Candidatus Woesearchaeota archaeon]
MLINKIKLENIRSYSNKEISFPEGSVLLSGDIGSGKSTVLLASEFALFGLEKGSGSALLRNGKNSGSVELEFDIDGKHVIVKRVLKRTDKSVKQDAGYLIVDRRKEEGTATELKAKILNLLNYPRDYLTRSKGLLYKYTVYTPQEEMKRILLESKEDRLHVLRKIFDIDKYKRVQENCVIFLRHLRSEIRVYDERLKEKDKKLFEKEERVKALAEIEGGFLAAVREFEKVKVKTSEAIENVSKYEEEMGKLNVLTNKLSLVERDYEHALTDKKRNRERLNSLMRDLAEVKEENFEHLKSKIQEGIEICKIKITNTENKLQDILRKTTVYNSKINNSLEIKNKILHIEECPTCYQPVRQEYKERIFKEQDELLMKIKIELDEQNKLEKEHRTILLKDKERLENLRNETGDIETKKIRYENFLRKMKDIKDIENRLNEIEISISKAIVDKERLMKEAEFFSGLDERYKNAKLEFAECSRIERKAEIRRSAIEEKIRFTNEIIKRIDDEIIKLYAVENKLGRLKETETWLDKHFVNLMGTIEKNVMNKLHNEFEDLFKKWFDIIIGNENIKVELDDEFTPVITQDGFEMDYLDLSGGEKTAVALAYRLSLNQVLNNLVGDVKTRDLLILDEPTDGFSSEQLDRVRLVLDELNMKQIIIVSHEDKIESFVDNVLKFKKVNGVSEVV